VLLGSRGAILSLTPPPQNSARALGTLFASPDHSRTLVHAPKYYLNKETLLKRSSTSPPIHRSVHRARRARHRRFRFTLGLVRVPTGCYRQRRVKCLHVVRCILLQVMYASLYSLSPHPTWQDLLQQLCTCFIAMWIMSQQW
jgi:hypothetical protein